MALFVFFLLHFLLVFSDAIVEHEEKSSLLFFRNALENRDLLASWNQSSRHCDWVGVTCQLGRVTSLALPTLGIQGPLSPSVFSLKGLLVLDLSSNLLHGEIPPEIANLKALSSLDLSNNSLSGEVPREIGHLQNLTYLYIGSNNLSGVLPREIGELSRLESFYGPRCSISGPLPEEMGKMSSLSKLDLSYNPLKCSIPAFLGKLQNLTSLNLAYAELHGSVPAELGRCRSLKSVGISFNSLSGSLPEELSQLPILSFSAERNQLTGSLPAWLGKWSQVASILLSGNQFVGSIPPSLGNCSMLYQISLNHNLLTGSIPEELCDAVALSEIDLGENLLEGTIEKTFIKCTNLTQLVLVGNWFVGSVPEYLSELPLMFLDIDSNNFTGTLPLSLWNSTNLMEFSAPNNFIKGPLPREIGNAIALQRLVLGNNHLKGTIPREIGNLINLSVLNMNGNQLVGRIPPELGDCRGLTTLDLGDNHLNGSIPEELAGLPMLQCLVLSRNNLSGPIPSKSLMYFRSSSIPDTSFIQHHGVFDLSQNMLSGSIPKELGECLVVVDLVLSNNLLSGEIPASLSNLSSLITLDLSGNQLNGSIPTELGALKLLQGLYLANNQLSGSIPGKLGTLSSLVKLNLTGNRLSGAVPETLGSLDSLTHLDLSSNELTSELPSSISHMVNLVGIYVQCNRFSGHLEKLLLNSVMWKVEMMNLSHNGFGGDLPRSLGNLSYLASLDVHENGFTGEIPQELGNLMQLEYFDASGNIFSGQIPEKLCSLNNLLYLDLAQNRLEGPIPQVGLCRNLSQNFLAGNNNLCGGVMGLDCQVKHLDGRWSLFSIRNLVGIIIAIMIMALAMFFAVWKWTAGRSRQSDLEKFDDNKLNTLGRNIYFMGSSRSEEPLSINLATFEQPLLKLTFVDILEATNNFCKTNIIGDGGFGTVYKATLSNGSTVAVKKLSQAKTQGHREFLAEMETLGKVKHQNLVPLLGYSSLGDEKLLVYEYMVNGSLDLWLRNRSGALEVLDWGRRLKIAVGSAHGLAFLHHGFTPHIIHRDIKASNILLNEDFEPKVADFGLARLISACETHVSTEIAGTFGYIPPEYGQSCRSTTRGDVYSFGVILLELISGKEPTGPEFKEIEGGNLVGWAFQKIKKNLAVDVLDPTVLDADSKPVMLKVLQIAALCLSDNPAKRPTMKHIWKLLRGLLQ